MLKAGRIISFANCLFFLAFYFPARSQHTIMRTFTVNDGLVSNQVRGFYQDQKGFIWIMTWEGISRFDGYAFRNYTVDEGLAHPLINAMIESQDHKIYVAENDGTVDVIENGEVRIELRKRFTNPINKFIPEPSGRILAPSDERGVCVFEEGSMVMLNRSGVANTVIDVVPDGNYFLVCGSKSGVMLPDHTFIRTWTDTLASYNCILKDKLNRIWVGTSKGLQWVNRSPSHSTQYDLAKTAFANAPWSRWVIRDMLQASDGSIWVAAEGGLIQIKPDQSYRLYGRNDGLPTDYITSIFEDRIGFLWIGTDQGVAQLDIKNTIDIFTIPEDIPGNTITDIQPALNGSAYIITNRSAVYNISPNRPFRPVELGMQENAYEFLIDGKDTLVSTEKGRYRLNGPDHRLLPYIPNSPGEYSIVANDGSIFSSSLHRITVLSSTENITDTTMNDYIIAMSAGLQGEVWIGTSNEGLYKVIAKKNSAGKMKLEWENLNPYLPEKTIRSLHADRNGNVWIGTRYSGLIQLYRNTSSSSYETRVYDRNDGFISDFIKSIASDQDGNIWVGTNAGIEKLIRTSDGYQPFAFSRAHNFFATIIKLAPGPDQTIWCTTTSGVAKIKDSRYETIPPSPVYVTSVSTSKKTILDPQYHLPFDLNYNQNSIDIAFSSNDFINGKQIKYSYRLIGSQDTSWSLPIPVHKVSFANLLPGNYGFEVSELGWNGRMGAKTVYRFRIRPPFWRQTWFILFSFLAFGGLLFSFYRYRISQVKQIQVVRDRIASDLHDEIGSSLTHVNILSEIGRMSSNAAASSQQLFKRIGEEAQSSSEALDDIIWSVNSRADTADDLISRMRRYASELFEVKGIAFSLLEEHFDENQFMGLELRRDFYLIYKELLRNIIRHAEATSVNVKIKGEGHLLWMEIRDNGHGFDIQASSDRQGLHSVKGRVTKWKGHFSIYSTPDSGTVISVGLPFRTRLFNKNG